MLAVGGSSKVKAPLCNYSTNRDGTVSLIAAGTANHGGSGKWNGLSGNRFFFGDEMKNLGTQTAEPWSGIQLESARRAAAAILHHLGQDEGWVCGHKEYTPGRKTDPHTLNMNAERVLIGALLSEAEMWTKPSDGPAAVQTLDDVKRVHAYHGNTILTAADIDYDENDPKSLDERYKIITARLLSELMTLT